VKIKVQKFNKIADISEYHIKSGLNEIGMVKPLAHANLSFSERLPVYLVQYTIYLGCLAVPPILIGHCTCSDSTI
jgi:hypothetical protein